MREGGLLLAYNLAFVASLVLVLIVVGRGMQTVALANASRSAIVWGRVAVRGAFLVLAVLLWVLAVWK